MKVYAVHWIPSGEIVALETTKHQAHNYRSYDGTEIKKNYEVKAYSLIPVNEENTNG